MHLVRDVVVAADRHAHKVVRVRHSCSRRCTAVVACDNSTDSLLSGIELRGIDEGYYRIGLLSDIEALADFDGLG